jgi:hypothetical protein
MQPRRILSEKIFQARGCLPLARERQAKRRAKVKTNGAGDRAALAMVDIADSPA